ncbi:MAG TPA: methyltransferase domain-containing protein [Microvirga sp.]|jgi:SAM-dependent methyltransferase
MNWRDYWNQDTPIYVSDRHKVLHYWLVANDIAAFVPHADAVVLDYGCGEALSANRVAARCSRLYLCDGAPLVRERLRDRFRNELRIAIIAPEEMNQIPEGSLDLVVVNSLLQYLSLDELRALLALWRGKLKPEGRLVLADVIPPDVSPLNDARALLAFAWKGGFVRSALLGLARTAVSSYRRIRDELGLAQYTPSELIELLRDSGFAAERQRQNMGHNQARMTFVARRA